VKQKVKNGLRIKAAEKEGLQGGKRKKEELSGQNPNSNDQGRKKARHPTLKKIEP